MNIEKLAKRLKEFTFDEIEMILECDCETELAHLLNEGKIVFEQGLYKYVEVFKEKTFELYPKPTFRKKKSLLFCDLAHDYLVHRKLTKDTLKGYKSQLKYNILPYFGEIQINKITYEMIVDFMQKMKTKYKPKTASNGVTLLGSILKYAFYQGVIKHNPAQFSLAKVLDLSQNLRGDVCSLSIKPYSCILPGDKVPSKS